MRSSVVFKQNNPTALGAGQQDVYTDLLTTRGRLRKMSGRKDLSFAMIEGADNYELICRFQSALESALKANMKVFVDSVSFTIQSWEKIDQLNHLYKFTLNTTVIA